MQAETGETPKALAEFPKLTPELLYAYRLYEALEEERDYTSLGMAGAMPAPLKLQHILVHLDFAGIRGNHLRRQMVRRVKSLDRTRIAIWSESRPKDTTS